MKKLEAYKQAKSDVEVAKETIDNLAMAIEEIGYIEINSSITIRRDSSDKQYMYAIGVLNSQLIACSQLDMDSTELQSNRVKVLEMRVLTKEREEWKKYYKELVDYCNSVHRLLDNDELFKLLEAPAKPKK